MKFIDEIKEIKKEQNKQKIELTEKAKVYIESEQFLDAIKEHIKKTVIEKNTTNTHFYINKILDELIEESKIEQSQLCYKLAGQYVYSITMDEIAQIVGPKLEMKIHQSFKNCLYFDLD